MRPRLSLGAVLPKPPVFLKPGDEVSVTVERLGSLTNAVVGPR